MEERIQKIMAQAGLGSRRDCEVLIREGRVTVNGQRAELGAKADPQKDQILVDGRPVKLAEPPVYIALHKPRGVLSAVTADDQRPTVRDLIDYPGRLYPVGRLDVDSEGLMLLTNDGELANRLTHPRYEHEKEYRVLVARRPDDEQLSTWRRGVVLEDDYRTAPAEVRVESLAGKGTWLRVILREGKKRQIRETGRLLGLPVVKIIRVRIGSLLLGSLKAREWRYLSEAEVAELQGKKAPAVKKPTVRPNATVRPDAAARPARREAGASSRRTAGQRSGTGRRPGPGAAGKSSNRSGSRRPGGDVLSGGAPAAKPGAAPGKPFRPKPPSASRGAERRAPRRPVDKGKRK